MSIFAPAAQFVAQTTTPTTSTTAPATTMAGEVALTPEAMISLGVLLLVPIAIGLAVMARVYRPSLIVGPDRLPGHRPAWVLFLALVIATTVWIGAQMALGIYRNAQVLPAAPDVVPVAPVESMGEVERRWSPEDLTDADFAYLATVPGIVALVVILVLDRLGGRQWPGELGLRGNQFLGGVGQGIVGIIIAIPLVLLAAVLSQELYQQVGYEHPTEHQLLQKVGEARNPLVTIALIVGATIVAPLWEELAFRGHLQTLLARWFSSAGAMQPRSEASDVTPPLIVGPPPLPVGPPPPSVGADHPIAATATMTLSAPSDAMSPPAPRRSAWRVWAAVLLTSAVFGIVHEPWSIPPIFVLSVCLGYAYERTGNLWTPITMHLLFNTSSTIVYMLIRPGG